MSFSEKLDSLISDYIQENKDNFHNTDPNNILLTSETIGEVIEKLLILNIRIWQLEDNASIEKKLGHVETYAQLKSKLDTCFKVKRPHLVATLDSMLSSIPSENIKIYK